MALQGLKVVSNSDWSADWRTLQALGARSLMDVKTWRQMVLAVARGRADVLLAPFPATHDLSLDVEGQTVAEKVFPALAALFNTAAVRRAYQECGYYNPRTSGWQVLNGKTRP